MEHLQIPEGLDDALRKFLTQSDRVAWNRYTDFDWSKVNVTQPHPLNSLQIAATKTALLVEDHLPGYCTEYTRLFPVDESVSPERAWHNRNMLHFVTRWCSEEDRHAHVLELYLRETRAVDPVALTAEMVREGVKKYTAPHEDHTQIFVYTTLQEKATQLFYQCLRAAINEPVLESILLKLSQDESRHCAFFSDMVRVNLHTRGEAMVALIKEAIDHFKMPLSDMLENYKRQAIMMIRAAQGYDYREAFTHLGRIVRTYADARTNSRSHTFDDLLNAIAAMSPA